MRSQHQTTHHSFNDEEIKTNLLAKLETCAPDNLKLPITNMLLGAFKPNSAEDFNITPFEKKGVFSKTIILVEYRDEKYILKETEKFNPKEKLCEILAMKWAAAVHATPLLKAASFHDSLALIQFVQHDFSALEKIDYATVISLADTLKSIHNLDVTNYPSLFPHKNKFLAFLLNQIQMLTNDHSHLHSYRKILDTINFLEEILTPYKLKFCHYDLHPWNLLVDKQKKVFAIDWESAGIGDELYDIATTSAYLRLNYQQEDTLLRRYYGNNLSKEIRWRYLLNKIQATLFYSLGFIFVCKEHQPFISPTEEKSLKPFHYFDKPLSTLFLLDLTSLENYQMSYRLIKSASILLNSSDYGKAVGYVIRENLNCYPRYNQIYQFSLLSSHDQKILSQLQNDINHLENNEDINLLATLVVALTNLFANNQKTHFVLLCFFIKSMLEKEFGTPEVCIIAKEESVKIYLNNTFLLFKQAGETNLDQNSLEITVENKTELRN